VCVAHLAAEMIPATPPHGRGKRELWSLTLEDGRNTRKHDERIELQATDGYAIYRSSLK
jgi:hypothetical protein